MKSLNFTDRRGDKYTFVEYSTGEIKVSQEPKGSVGLHQIDFSEEAVEKLKEFLGKAER
jgi:hypothetical protein